MGGPGSGGWYRWHKKETVEDHLSLDVNRLQRDGWLRPGLSVIIWWERGDETVASIRMTTLASAIELIYRVRPGGGEWTDVREQVPLTWTPCHYGGRRPWFRCPCVVDGRPCGRRVAKLYLGGRYFLRRRCHDLRYESQREPPHSRARSRTVVCLSRLR